MTAYVDAKQISILFNFMNKAFYDLRPAFFYILATELEQTFAVYFLLPPPFFIGTVVVVCPTSSVRVPT